MVVQQIIPFAIDEGDPRKFVGNEELLTIHARRERTLGLTEIHSDNDSEKMS